jgi:hypothetical protein
MFKSIKEFFVGKPKVEETPAEVPYKVEAVSEPAPAPVIEPVPAPVAETVTVTVVEPAPVVEEIKPETVVISISDNMNVNVSTQSDTITLTPPVADSSTWPFPKEVPLESEVKKKRTFVKREETATKKKPTPAITANKTKPRKKK